VVAVALSAGHLVQTLAARDTAPTPVAAARKPVEVVQLAGSAGPLAEPVPAPAPPLPQAALSVLPARPVPPVTAADPCPVTLDVMADPGAMLGVTLIAPCRPTERVVLRHAGLAVTAMTTATGALFASLPGLQSDAVVEVKFADGSAVEAGLALPELVALRRFGVQWQGDDAFQVYGLEDGTAMSAERPGFAPIGLATVTGGFLTRLGDPTAPNPLFAEIYTYPADGAADLLIEAAVTPVTCGREILGETLASVAGEVTITDLTLAMPACDAAGDFLVLNNLGLEPTLTAEN